MRSEFVVIIVVFILAFLADCAVYSAAGGEDDRAAQEEESAAPHKATRKQLEFAEKTGIPAPDYWCGACGFMLVGSPKFCPNCGKAVKWDD